MYPVLSKASGCTHRSERLAFLLIMFVLTGCVYSNTQQNNDAESFGIREYDLNHPDRIFSLPYELAEISGLSYFKDSVVVAVQDELGKLFFYDYSKGKLIDEFIFGEHGDYEGVEVVDSNIFIIKSNGDLFAVSTHTKKTRMIKTPLRSKNDVEGLGFHSQSNQLVFACKESSKVGDSSPKGKAFYGYEVANDRFVKEPLFNIKRSDLSEAYGDEVRLFKPSGLAAHPITGELYILAHGGKWLVHLNRSYEVVGITKLKGRRFNQPEGICFTPNGDMMISNEGDGDRGNILYFRYQSPK